MLDHKQRWLDVLEAGKILNGPIKSFIPETFKSNYNDSWNKIATTSMLTLIIIVMIIQVVFNTCSPSLAFTVISWVATTITTI